MMMEEAGIPEPLQGSAFFQNADQGQAEEEEVVERIQVCVFELSERLFALRVLDVQEILEDAEIFRVPTTPHFLRGVINLRGDIVPVVDIRDVLHLRAKPKTRESRIMILHIKHVQLGILVDAIKEVTRIEKRIAQPDAVGVGISDGKFITNVIYYKDSFLVLLNLDNLYQAIQL
jgi:purine-binding chemotaxis protein CheW